MFLFINKSNFFIAINDNIDIIVTSANLKETINNVYNILSCLIGNIPGKRKTSLCTKNQYQCTKNIPKLYLATKSSTEFNFL